MFLSAYVFIIMKTGYWIMRKLGVYEAQYNILSVASVRITGNGDNSYLCYRDIEKFTKLSMRGGGGGDQKQQ